MAAPQIAKMHRRQPPACMDCGLGNSVLVFGIRQPFLAEPWVVCYNGDMQTPIDFGKNFLNSFFSSRDPALCIEDLAYDLVWITPKQMYQCL